MYQEDTGNIFYNIETYSTLSMSVPLIRLNISPDSAFDELFRNWTKGETTHNNLMIFLFFFFQEVQFLTIIERYKYNAYF